MNYKIIYSYSYLSAKSAQLGLKYQSIAVIKRVKFLCATAMVRAHQINFCEINSHVINSYKNNFSWSQLLGDQLL